MNIYKKFSIVLKSKMITLLSNLVLISLISFKTNFIRIKADLILLNNVKDLYVQDHMFQILMVYAVLNACLCHVSIVFLICLKIIHFVICA